MANRIRKILSSRHLKSNLLLIITAAALLEMISFVQYYYSHSLLEDELDKHAETELVLKSVIASSLQNTIEDALLSHIRDIQHDLAYPDSMYSAAVWLVKFSKRLAGGGIAFSADFYPQKGRLFEPYAYWKDGRILTTEISDLGHDYTQTTIFKSVFETDSAYWSQPYHDTLVTDKDLISYCLPVHDSNEKTIGLLYMDIDTKLLGDSLNSHHLFPSSFDLLVSNDGELIAGPNESFVSKTTVDYVVSLLNDSTVEKRESENGGCRVVEFVNPENGESAQLFISQVKGQHRWQVAVVCYDKEVFGDLKRMQLIILLLMVAAFVILAGIVQLVARNDMRQQKTEIEKRRIDSELRVASKIQKSMLPTQAVTDEGLEVRGFLKPAREVGGDLYDYFVRDEKLFFCIGDVSGKGPASAMLMSVTRALFRSASAHESNPAHIMQSINETICQGNESNMFVTMFIGVLDLPTGRLRYCNAGHDAPYVLPFVSAIDVQSHLPIGVFDDFKYGVQEMQIQPDNTIFLYTDGLTEAKNRELKLFGIKRVEEALGLCAQQNMQPKDILETVTAEMHRFVKDAEQSDDLTMLVIHYTPKQFDCKLTETLVLKNNISEVSRFSTFMKSATASLGIEAGMARKLRLAVEEAVVNVIDYAYPADTEGDIIIRIMSDGQTLHCQIIDSGVPFDPTAKEKVDTSLPAEDRQIGGLGILLVRELMDSINYERNDGKNVLTLIKRLKS